MSCSGIPWNENGTDETTPQQCPTTGNYYMATLTLAHVNGAYPNEGDPDWWTTFHRHDYRVLWGTKFQMQRRSQPAASRVERCLR